MLLKITLKCLSLRVVLDLLNQVVNVDPCDRFTVEFGTPGMLKSMFSSSVARLNSLSALKWCNVTMFCGNKLFFHYVCACAWFHRFPCSIVSMHDANVFRQLHRFPCSIWRAKFFLQTFIIDLLWTGRFSFLHKNTFCVLRFPRSITDWIGFGLGWFGKLNTWCFSKRLLSEFSNWLLFNCRTQLIIPSGPIVIVLQMRSLVVVEELSMVFHTKLLQSSIFQLLESHKLEVSLEE